VFQEKGLSRKEHRLKLSVDIFNFHFCAVLLETNHQINKYGKI